MSALAGKTAIVTGASAGLGAECAVALADAGADVAIAARRADRLRETQARVEERGRRCLAQPADVTSPDDCRRVVDQTVEHFGRVDILVNNAGVATAVPSTRETPAQFRAVLDVNLFGSYWMAQACGRVMQPGSAIVNVGSVLGLTSGRLPQAAYASSKAGIIGLTRDLAQQWTGRKGIRVNALAPGFFHSEMIAEYPEGYIDQILQRVPARRVGEPSEFAAAVVFLASDAASYISGAVLPVDGGLLTN
jgi:NAD(P)-dependent dehydrogenase (short-subunit alcohol dehydrogenase family)